MTTSKLFLLIGSIYVAPHMSGRSGWQMWIIFMFGSAAFKLAGM